MRIVRSTRSSGTRPCAGTKRGGRRMPSYRQRREIVVNHPASDRGHWASTNVRHHSAPAFAASPDAFAAFLNMCLAPLQRIPAAVQEHLNDGGVGASRFKLARLA
jgi:hypothetical protein